MRTFRNLCRTTVFVYACILVPAACGTPCERGALQISEMMLLPHAPSAAQQWIEFVNLSEHPIALADVRLKLCGHRAGHTKRVWRLGTELLAPGGRVLVGGEQARVAKTHKLLPPAFRLPREGRLVLTSHGRTVDTVAWTRPRPTSMPALGTTRAPPRASFIATDGETNRVPPIVFVRGQSLVRRGDGSWRKPAKFLFDGRNRGSPGAYKPPIDACYDDRLGPLHLATSWRARNFDEHTPDSLKIIAVRMPNTQLGQPRREGFVAIEAGARGIDLAGIGLRTEALDVGESTARTVLLPVVGCGALAPRARALFRVAYLSNARRSRTSLPRTALRRVRARYSLVDLLGGQGTLDSLETPSLAPGVIFLRDALVWARPAPMMCPTEVAVVVP